MSVTTGRGTPSSASHRRGGWYWHANGRGNNDQNGSAQCPRFCLLSLGSKYSMASNALSVASSDMDVNDEQHTQTVDVEFYSEYQDEEFEGGMDQRFVQGEQEGGSKKKRVSIVMEGQKREKSAVAMKDIGQVLGEKKSMDLGCVVSSHHHQPRQSGWNNLVVMIDKRQCPRINQGPNHGHY